MQARGSLECSRPARKVRFLAVVEEFEARPGWNRTPYSGWLWLSSEEDRPRCAESSGSGPSSPFFLGNGLWEWNHSVCLEWDFVCAFSAQFRALDLQFELHMESIVETSKQVKTQPKQLLPELAPEIGALQIGASLEKTAPRARLSQGLSSEPAAAPVSAAVYPARLRGPPCPGRTSRFKEHGAKDAPLFDSAHWAGCSKSRPQGNRRESGSPAETGRDKTRLPPRGKSGGLQPSGPIVPAARGGAEDKTSSQHPVGKGPFVPFVPSGCTFEASGDRPAAMMRVVVFHEEGCLQFDLPEQATFRDVKTRVCEDHPSLGRHFLVKEQAELLPGFVPGSVEPVVFTLQRGTGPLAEVQLCLVVVECTREVRRVMLSPGDRGVDVLSRCDLQPQHYFLQAGGSTFQDERVPLHAEHVYHARCLWPRSQLGRKPVRLRHLFGGCSVGRARHFEYITQDAG